MATVKINGGFELRAKSVIAWNPDTKEITSGPAKGQLAETEQEARKQSENIKLLKQRGE